jgi:hypothetical protein
MKEFLRKTKKVKRGTTLKEADVDGAWLAAYARIARRCRNDKDMGVTRYSYEPAPGGSPFSGNEWAICRGMVWHPSLHLLWMSFSSAPLDLRGEALKLEGTTGVEEVERFDAWEMMAVRATDYLDDVMKQLDTYMTTQLMKAAAFLHATNAVKRSGDGGAAYQ